MTGAQPSGGTCQSRPVGWNQFWFAPSDSTSLAVIRIGCGILVLGYLLSYGSDAPRWLANTASVVPTSTVRELMARSWAEFSIFDYCSSPAAVWTVHGAALLAALAMTLGVATRVSTAVTWLLLLSYLHRVPFANGLAEPVLAMLLAYLVIEPGARSLSLDRWWVLKRGGRPGDAMGWTATVATRLIQLHLCALVLMTVTNRLAGEPWWSGTAVWWLIARTETRLIDLTGLGSLPQYYLVNLWTHAVVAIELVGVVLLWSPRFRSRTQMALGAIWFSLALLTGQLLWLGTMLLGLVAFVPPTALSRLLPPAAVGAGRSQPA